MTAAAGRTARIRRRVALLLPAALVSALSLPLLFSSWAAAAEGVPPSPAGLTRPPPLALAATVAPRVPPVVMAVAATPTSTGVTAGTEAEVSRVKAQIKALQVRLAELSAGPAPTPRGHQWANGLEAKDANGGDDNEDGAETLSQEKVQVFTAMVVVSVIVLISILFERAEDWAENHVGEVLEPVLKSVLGELTILGFIGLIMFLITKEGKGGLDTLVCNDDHGWFRKNHELCPRNESQVLSNATEPKWNGECPENPLIELTETAHMILFFVMLLFLAECYLLIRMGKFPSGESAGKYRTVPYRRHAHTHTHTHTFCSSPRSPPTHTPHPTPPPPPPQAWQI